MEWLGLRGKVVVVTGAAGGLGHAICHAFADAGCRLALLEIDKNRCHVLSEELAEKGCKHIVLSCDVSSEQQILQAALDVEALLGTTNVLVNNAAILSAGSVGAISLNEWNKVININLTGYMLCARTFARHMKQLGGGSIIHTGSISGSIPQANSGAYSIAKAGVHMLSKLLAVEMGSEGIRSNVVCPAMVLTPMSEKFYQDKNIKNKRESMVPAGRIGNPDDIAQTILWLASPRASYITAEEIFIDGGIRQNLLNLIPRPGFNQ